MAQPLLEVKNLSCFYTAGTNPFGKKAKKQALFDVSFTVNEGEVLGLVGESGCGKTTLSRAILGINRDITGEIIHHTERPRMVFQDPASSLNPARSIGWILEEPLRCAGVGRAMHRILHGEDTLFIRMPRGIDELDGVLSCLFSAMARRPEGFELTVQGCLLQLFGLIVREHLYAKTAPGAHRRLDRQLPLRDALRYMEEHYAAPVTLDELAAAAGMSRRYFCTFFRTMTGRTPMEHLNLYRIETAGELLLSTDRPVSEIAGLCGFDDASYFAKLFRRHMGCSPRRYRTVARGEKR